jgi:hypothetical protein
MADDARNNLKSFTADTAPRTGRMKGARNKLGADFLYALQREFEAHGESAIRRVRVDDPTGFLKVIASVLPKELEITDSRLKDVPDEHLDAIVEFINRRLGGGTEHSGGREGSSLN